MIVARGLGRGGPQVMVAGGLGRRQMRTSETPVGGFGRRVKLRPRRGLTLREQIIGEDDLLLLLAASLISRPQ